LGHVRIPLKEYKSFARDTTLSLCRSIEVLPRRRAQAAARII
jgi:hypothetical protein